MENRLFIKSETGKFNQYFYNISLPSLCVGKETKIRVQLLIGLRVKIISIGLGCDDDEHLLLHSFYDSLNKEIDAKYIAMLIDEFHFEFCEAMDD